MKPNSHTVDSRRRRSVLAAVGAGATVGFAGCLDRFRDEDTGVEVNPDAVSGSWPTTHVDSHNSRFVDVDGPSEKPEEVWRVPRDRLGLRVADSVVYQNSTDERSNQGRAIPSGEVAKTEPAIADGGLLAITSERAYVNKGDPGGIAVIETRTGTEIGATEFSGYARSSTLVDETLLTQSLFEPIIHAIDETGTKLWEFEAVDQEFESPVVIENVVAMASSEVMYGLDFETGTVEWSIKFEETMHSKPVVCDSQIVVGSQTGTVTAFDSDGDRQWYVTPNDGGFVDGLAVRGTTVYANVDHGDDKMGAIEADGTTETIGVARGSVGGITATEDLLYVVSGKYAGSSGADSSESTLEAIEPTTGRSQWHIEFNSTPGRPVVLDGTILLQLRNGEDTEHELVCLQEP